MASKHSVQIVETFVEKKHSNSTINDEETFFKKLRRRSSAVILDLFSKRRQSYVHKRRASFNPDTDQEEKRRSLHIRRKSIPAYLG